jgi:hypothetical protein
MALITTDDLKADALWRAGEPTDGSSDYDSKVMDHMQSVYDTFVNGGTLGTKDVAQAAGLYEHLVDIPTTDWMWLRKFPPYAFNTTPAIIGSSASVPLNQGTQIGTVTVTNGSTTITFSVAPAVSVQGWRLKLLTQGGGIPNPPITVPRIVSHTAGATTATLDAAWNQETQTVNNFVIYQAEYSMPSDFVRFCEAWMVQGGWVGGSAQPRLDVGSYEQVMNLFPLGGYNQGPPNAAGRLSTGVLMVNRWDTFSYRIEGSYIFQPDTLAIGVAQEPLIPVRYRHALSIGAAMLVALDKVDSRTHELSSAFREILVHMGNETRHEQKAGSEKAGRHLYRQGRAGRGLKRTTSGLPLF